MERAYFSTIHRHGSLCYRCYTRKEEYIYRRAIGGLADYTLFNYDNTLELVARPLLPVAARANLVNLRGIVAAALSRSCLGRAR